MPPKKKVIKPRYKVNLDTEDEQQPKKKVNKPKYKVNFEEEEKKVKYTGDDCIKILESYNITDISSFKEWSRQNHPDKGGDTEIFQKVSNCVDELLKKKKEGKDDDEEEEKDDEEGQEEDEEGQEEDEEDEEYVAEEDEQDEEEKEKDDEDEPEEREEREEEAEADEEYEREEAGEDYDKPEKGKRPPTRAKGKKKKTKQQIDAEKENKIINFLKNIDVENNYDELIFEIKEFATSQNKIYKNLLLEIVDLNYKNHIYLVLNIFLTYQLV